ncbi:O-antigen ligase family protein [Elusimicrobiota bacterium]
MGNFLIIVLHALCPLLFFTNLTRNPYETQIALVNILTTVIAAGWIAYWLWKRSQGNTPELKRRSFLPPLQVILPLALFVVICWLSTFASWLTHVDFFKAPILAEGLKFNLFWIVNVVVVLGIGCYAGSKMRDGQKHELSLDLPTLAASGLFGLGWFLFPHIRSQAPSSMETSFLPFVWNTYGALLWSAYLSWLFFRLKKVGASLFFTINFAVGALASLYGAMQYFGFDPVWPKNMNPYGSRAISTFGNPNFLSSYLAVLMPFAFSAFWFTKDKLQSGLFAMLALIYEIGLLSTLTRSSWAGAFAGIGFIMALAAIKRKELRIDYSLKKAGVIIVLFIALFVLWPSGSSTGYSPSAFERLVESVKTTEKNPDDAMDTYGPFYQRLLIWSSCWKFVEERPILGKGVGLLELFFPFYQGELLYQKRFQGHRTHANNAHCEIIEIWSQTGTIGIGVALWFLVALFWWSWKTLRAQSHVHGAAVPLGLWAGIIAMLVDNILNVSLHFTVPAYLFWWEVGVLLTLTYRNNLPELPMIMSEKYKRWCLRGLIVVTVMIGGSMFWRFSKQWLGNFYYFRGFVLFREKNPKPALDRLVLSHKYFPMEVNRNYEMGNVYSRMQDFKKALWAYNEALKANPGYDEIFFNKAVLGLRNKDLESAQRDYLTSLALNPTNRSTYMGITRLFLTDVDRYAPMAIRVLNRGLHFFKDDVEFINNLASFYSRTGEKKKALDYFFKALEINPSYKLARDNIMREISNLKRTGHQKEAKWAMNKFMELPLDTR